MGDSSALAGQTQGAAQPRPGQQLLELRASSRQLAEQTSGPGFHHPEAWNPATSSNQIEARPSSGEGNGHADRPILEVPRVTLSRRQSLGLVELLTCELGFVCNTQNL